VREVVGTVAAAVGVFAGTNVDDIIVLTVLFLSARSAGRPRPWQIWIGQYTGIGVLVVISVLAALGLTIVPDQWVGVLGLVPLALGVRGLVGVIRTRGDGRDAAPVAATGLASVAGVTIANGADNVSVYTPLLRTIGVTNSVVTVTVFAVLIAVWCAAGSWLGSHRRIIAIVQRYGLWIVPAVFMLIGAIIIGESGVIGELTSLG
jgi:cadmium resistance protein CadD (predicted permease)